MKMIHLPFSASADAHWFKALFKSHLQNHTDMHQRLKIKVCGMRDQQNIMDVAQAGADFIGFIFYEKSPRYVGDHFDSIISDWIHNSARTVGVFVNEDAEKLLHTARRYRLDFVQLHGQESPEYCQYLQSEGLQIIKAFGVAEGFDFAKLDAYVPYIQYFLFDTKAVEHGGTGRKFDWSVLEGYPLSVPFFLSGGIGPADVAQVLEFTHPHLAAIDVNSRFELNPGYKNVDVLDAFATALRPKNVEDDIV